MFQFQNASFIWRHILWLIFINRLLKTEFLLKTPRWYQYLKSAISEINQLDLNLGCSLIKRKTAWSGLKWIDMNVNGLWVGIVPTNTPNGLVLLNYSVGPINMSGRDGKYGILSVLTRFRVMKFAFCINKGGHLRSLLYFLPSQRFPMIIN